LTQILEKYRLLKEVISKWPRVAVAFSGGVDSSLLLYAAHEVHGDGAFAFFGQSPLLGPAEVEEARRIAAFVGAPLHLFEISPLDDSRLVENGPLRCFYCKKGLYKVFVKAATDHGAQLLDGSNLDDDDSKRPGSRAVKELGAVMPLRLAELSKAEIRALARRLGLPNWQRPSGSCLATRIGGGQEITRERLELVDRAEALLISFGIDDCRVRLLVDYVLVQIPERDFIPFISQKIPLKLREILKTGGYREFFLDLSGRDGILS